MVRSDEWFLSSSLRLAFRRHRYPSVGHDYGQPCDAAEPGIEGVGGRADVANYMLRAIGEPQTFRQTVGIAN
jgi:hypothetical protein